MNSVIRLYREAFSGLPREVWLISLAAFVNRAGTMVLAFLAVWLFEVHGLSSGHAAQFLSLWGLGAFFGVQCGGRACDRVGPVPVQILSFVGTAAGFMALSGIAELWLVGLTVFTIGLLGEGFRPANAALLAASCDPSLTVRAFAFHRLAINAGWAIGPVLGGIVSEYVGWDLVFQLDAASCVISAGLLWLWFGRPSVRHRARPAPREDDDEPGRSPWTDPTTVAICLCTLGIAISFLQFLSTLPLYLAAHGWRKDEIGYVEAINPVLIILFEMILVHRLQRPNPLFIIAVGAASTAVGFLLLGWSLSFLWVGGCVALMTFGEMLDAPFASSFLANRAPSKSRGRYMGLYALAFSVAFIIAPAGAGFVVEAAGWTTLWVLCGALSAMSALGFSLIGRGLDRGA